MIDFWKKVDSDKRNWNRNQKILFWWVVSLLPQMKRGGVIMQPDKAPLTDAEIVEVCEALLPEEGQTRSYLDATWQYEDQKIVIPSKEGNLVTVDKGNIEISEDSLSDLRKDL
jgi:hypothetical protein